MPKTIPIKDFRAHLATIADKVEEGQSFVVIRRSRPSFRITPVNDDMDGNWETVIDFTDDNKKKGVKIEDTLTALADMD